MLAATLVDSAPLVPITLCITQRHGAHEDLHDAQVVENREQRSDEDDDGQHLEREDHAELIVGRAQFVAEDEFAAFDRIAEHVIDDVAQRP